MRTPAALAALALIVGSGVALILGDRLPAALAQCAAGAAALTLISAATSVSFDDVPDASMAIGLGFFLAGLSLGADAAARVYHPPLLVWFDARPSRAAPAVLEGTLREDAARTAFGASLLLDIRRAGELRAAKGRTDTGSLKPVTGGARLSVSGVLAASRSSGWRAGRTVRITATLRYPTFYLDPGVRDERRALARRGVMLVGSVKSGALVDVTSPASRVSEAAAAVRAWTRNAILSSISRWSTRSGGIADAILLGDRTGLSDDDVRRLQDAGTYHVIAISGGNIAILTALLIGVLRALGVPSRVAAGVTIVSLVAYGQVVVSASSVERAIAAAVVYLTARILDHRASPLNVLAVAALFGLALSPVTLLDPGFLLSFGATFGILLMVHRLAIASWRGAIVGRTVRVVIAMFASTAAAELALLPIGAALFARVTFAGLLLNFAAIPLMSVVQVATIAAVATSVIHPEFASWCGWIAHVAARALVDSAQLADLAPWTHRDVTSPSWWLIAIYYTALGAALAHPGRVLWRALIAAAVNAAMLIVVAPAWTSRDVVRASSGLLRVVFLDVGQGDATAVVLSDGRAILVDAGGMPTAPPVDSPDDDRSSFDVGARVVGPALRALGVARLESLVITHGDPDHIGGAPSVIRQFSPRAIWEGVPVPPHPGLRALVANANSAGSVWRTLRVGDEERSGGASIRVLHPPAPEWERQRVRNEDSVVLEIRVGDVSVILPGDIGREGERAILPLLGRSPIVVLKAPHHGSATSSTQELLDRLRPTAVVFSAGRANQFGHPHPAVVARYRAIGARLFSTADDGAVILETDGRRAALWTWTGRSESLTAASGSR
ncbi:MAG TPA: DNA internalization-related competence protein ComEC/Rec2 [Vicinamibacterales bacterium]|nr:DNA internalization-related competence protein ComEC/Rec2 [Vicinamibacterales bacterium]